MYYKKFINYFYGERDEKLFTKCLLLLSTGFVLADGHSDAEKEVISKISEYWDARNSADWSTVVAMSSSNLEC